MFFIVSKLAYFFIAPLNWIIALLIWRFFTKSLVIKKGLSIVIIVFVLFFGNEVIYTRLVTAWQPKPVQINKLGNYEAGILLGGLSSFDKYGKGFLNAASDRLVEILVLYKTKKIKKIVISGGSVYNDRPKEANYLYKTLLLLGIPGQDLIIENRSRTTFENAIYTKEIIDSLKLPPPFVLVTSAMHEPRAEKVFAKAGLPVVAFPSDFRVLDKKFDFDDYFIPKLYTISDWNMFLKEVFGLLGYKLFGKV
ncbi:YdcF family protein [Segetibacter koreensis]|uniref:YdcF family protein n=1 Tax=Segetibacter koreensis TaxID=398037 RepID=UPI00035F0DC3|nr:YdcF family protein [Segetibacter koreensis]